MNNNLVRISQREDMSNYFTSQQKNHPDISELKNKFLGASPRAVTSVSVFDYYHGLYAWSLHQYIKVEGWKVVKILKNLFDEPRYDPIDIDYDKVETLLVDANLLLKKGRTKLIVTIGFLNYHGSLQAFQVESSTANSPIVRVFIEGVIHYAKEHNFYRGKKIEFGFMPHFLDLRNTSWDSVVLDSAIKKEIKANTVDFFKNREVWRKYDVPLKRGILLSGAPGTGKTLICKALMAAADGITCISAQGNYLESGSIEQVFDMAEDLSPSIIFVEDIDFIGKEREEFSINESSLVTLLNTMDGIQQIEEIVTVATTNHVDMLDKALKDRPSRFDRVIDLPLPDLAKRRELLELLSRKIPLEDNIKRLIVKRTEGFTPAQLQEVLYSLVIEQPDLAADTCLFNLSCTEDFVDNVISRVNRKSKRHLGYYHIDIPGSNGKEEVAA